MVDAKLRRIQRGRRAGIATMVLVGVLVVLVVVVGVGLYFGVVAPGPGSTKSADTMILASSSASHSTVSSSGSSGTGAYSGTFNFSLPLGPSGERVLSNGTVQTYNSVQVGSGSFTFSINPLNYSGTGSGHGTLVITTTGFCSGSVTVHYTFAITDATTLLGGNVTVFVGTPTPSTAMVTLTCTGPMTGVDTSTNNPLPFESVYSGEMSAATIPVTVSQHLVGNIDYYYTITRTG